MTNHSFENIKKELQGNKGLIKRIRKVHLPDTVRMSELAQEAYSSKFDSYENVDFALDNLLALEYEIYLEKQKLITEGFIDYADIEANELEFPVLRSVIDEYKELSLTNAEPTKILSGVTNVIIALADSNRQSRVSRSGSSLMHHISFLLGKHGFEFKKDYQREYVLKEGCKLDFFFPDIDNYKDEPKNCCSVACQTTSNDRFRLTFAQMPADTRNRACTAIGNANFGKKLGPDSLSDNKLEEAKKNGVKFVIFEHAIDCRLKKSQTVMSYNEWFSELKAIKNFW
ncbi:hypothetical protein BTO06_07075 [Tenacibaculum sp. SZ-18]|uniref:type II restriction endonuclease n=1 Tax=Tenacibaculum sp. SZ-18 TaxID=754423 RepID=UPI000C2D1F58|nr:type II restriction endonuclease [Tenacibaculum sp. SZ-18]AUC14913.1 hypothetical protein BTO06_07075 [Tenacibaculum sp. SZ-18]